MTSGLSRLLKKDSGAKKEASFVELTGDCQSKHPSARSQRPFFIAFLEASGLFQQPASRSLKKALAVTL
jgi:hypothetical protein